MDFKDTPEEAAFRDEARQWLEANVPADDALKGLDEIERSKLWQKRKYDAGWACIRWPKEYGGRDASAIEQVIWNQEESRFNAPSGVFAIGQGMAAPTMMAWASEEDKVKHLPPLASGEHIWCQLFSEPAGGSDLAALRTQAKKDGDDWVINGQKIWTSGAHFSDYGILVVRTDPTVAKHKGLTYFFFDMKSPGVDVKPIKQISGGANFNEVYFTDVRIPDSQRLGAVGQGWQVALTTLMNERAAIGGGGMGVGFDRIFELAKRVNIDDRPAIEDRQVRAKLADWYCQESGLRFTGYRSMSALSRGDTPGPENSIGKYVGASKTQDMASFAMDLLELSGAVLDSEHGEESGIYAATYMGAPGGRIAGGSDEIMLNILAERVLGMPQDVRLDKGIPFNEIPTGSN
ncbi:MAG: acyl-CoA dehydrogenase family protein [Pseudomonadales bacterium]|nr:acyl-CoA dehydrogenase [Gammaproteobacteria bacterium]MCH2353613.1 acyl-CoA dehydrogenase family protein [Pseudomonadales bacterium]MCS5569302.1 acyl-CoA dehydrogenase family protein [Pseudomonadales bacterium]MED5554841.1 acyl-CoA dehydrogenase family protein [Pseudomonadota bacterium]